MAESQGELSVARARFSYLPDTPAARAVLAPSASLAVHGVASSCARDVFHRWSGQDHVVLAVVHHNHASDDRGASAEAGEGATKVVRGELHASDRS